MSARAPELFQPETSSQLDSGYFLSSRYIAWLEACVFWCSRNLTAYSYSITRMKSSSSVSPPSEFVLILEEFFRGIAILNVD